MTTLQLSLLQPASLLLPSQPVEPKSFALRDYQQQVIKDLYQLYRQDIKRPFIYAPTGSGKTAIASKILADAVSRNRRCLFLVHRDPLVQQTQKALAVHGIEAGIIKAGHKENRTLNVQIASIQSLAQREFPDDIDVVVIDECHTTCWYRTFDRVKESYPNAFYVGLTASPWRTKSTEYMGQHFNGIVKAPSVAQLINAGYLAPPRYFGFGGLLDLAEIDNGNDGEFNEKQVQRACMKAGFNERIIKEYQKFAQERTGIIFCAGVEQSRLITKLFNEANISCEHIEADTNSDERAAICKRLQLGETRVLSSVGTLTEGFDEPRVSCVVLARPTRSRALLFQMAGRGLRISLGKKDCLMLDFGENFTRLGFLTDPQPIQLEPLKRKSDTHSMLKECPECHKMISTYAVICPFCGYEFGTSEGEEDDDTDAADAEMGELFANDQKPKIKYLRTQIRRLYKQKLSINKIWKLFEDKWEHPAPNAWHKGAVFGKRGSKSGGDTEVKRQKYLSYLYQINPNPKDKFWFKFHIELEFGKQKNTSEKTDNQRQQKYKNPSLDDTLPKRLTWWEVLGVEPTDSLGDIKNAYRKLARQYHPDSQNMPADEANEKTKLLNRAYEQAKVNFA